MKKTHLLLGIGVLAMSLALCAGRALSDDKEMEEYMKFAAPGEHHKHLEDMAGEWEVTGKMWMGGPDQPAEECKGKSTIRLVHGGRYTIQEYESEMGGMVFTGTGISGYDNMKKKHWSIWFDSMSTQAMATEGDCSDGCKTITFIGAYPDPQGRTWGWKSVTKTVDQDHVVFEAYNILPPELAKQFPDKPAEHKAMELHYTRKK